MDNSDNREIRHGNSRIWIALVFVIAGGSLLLQRMGLPIPDWVFSWQVLLIVIGICLGFGHGFRGAGWVILILVGLFYLFDDLAPGASFHRYAWPIAILAIGFFMLVRPRGYGYRRYWENRYKYRHSWKDRYSENQPASSQPKDTSENFKDTSDNFFESTSIFGGVKKIVLSKNFQGGSITCVMGGCEVDLTQADFEKVAVIDISQTFGGTKLIVPPHWQVRIDVSSVFGGVEDKRQSPIATNSDKLLIIKGSSVFGGIEIKNY